MENLQEPFFQIPVPDVTILIPAYNEEQSIEQVVLDVSKVMELENYAYEILVVNDDSWDRTVLRLPEISKLRRVFRFTKGGSGAARKTGIKEAHGKVIVMLDADNSYDARDIPKMLELFPEYDMVNGARVREVGNLTWLRKPVKWVIGKVGCWVARHDIPDLNTGLKAFKKDIMMQYLDIIPDRFSCVSTMTLAFIMNGYKVKFIPVKYFERVGKSKFHPIKDTLRYLKTVLKIGLFFRRKNARR